MADLITKYNNTPPVEVGLSIASRVIYQLGEQLISDEFVALAELIKNSYDADCITVKVTVDTNAETPHGRGRIVIDDNGNGMTESILCNHFMRISTDFKRKEKYSPYFNRALLGEKGLGRLSIQRLGRYVSIYTTPRIDRLRKIIPKTDWLSYEKHNRYNLTINWGQFEDDRDLSEVKATLSFLKEENPKLGTVITIEGIRNIDFWQLDKKSQARFRTEIFGMVSPFSQEKFQIQLEINGVKFSNESIDENVLKLMSDIDVSFAFQDWCLEFRIIYRKRYFDRLIDSLIASMSSKGYKDYKINEPYTDLIIEDKIYFFNDNYKINYPYLRDIKFQKVFSIDGDERFAFPGDFEGVFYVAEQSQDALKESQIIVTEQGYPFATTKELKAVWDASVGVYLFRNDFRILPYGPGKDWLGFTDRSQREKANAYKNHTVSGYFQLGSLTKETLKEQTNRQGLIEDEYGLNFLTLAKNVIAEVAFQNDVKVRTNLSVTETANAKELRTKDKKIIFYKVETPEQKKENLIKEAQKHISSIQLRVKSEEVTALKRNIETLVTVAKEEEKGRKQERYHYERRIEELSSMITLAGQGIIVESLTHEFHRIQNNIAAYSKDSQKLLMSSSILDQQQRKKLKESQEKILSEVYVLEDQLNLSTPI